MRKLAALLVGALLMMGVTGGVASAYTINYNYAVDGNNFTSSYSGVLNNFAIETFDNANTGLVPTSGLIWEWSGSATILNGSSSGLNAAPFGVSTPDQTKYVSVPNPASSGTVSVKLGGVYDYFGLWWGSVDAYNTLAFYKEGVLVDTVTGSVAVNPSVANGNQTAPSTNLYVNILDLNSFDEFRMTSTQYAFEADNIAVGVAPVPEPGTMMLLGLGIFGLAIFGKRRLNKDA